MRRFTITFEWGHDDQPQPQPPDLDALVEHGDPNPSDRAELDGRRPIGFWPSHEGGR